MKIIVAIVSFLVLSIMSGCAAFPGGINCEPRTDVELIYSND